MIRSFSPDLLAAAVERYPGWDREAGFDPSYWLSIDENLMLVDGEDVGLLTFEYPGLYNGHWFFNSRGKEARDVANRMLDYAFKEHQAQVIRGITPVSLLGARRLAKILGFKSYGMLEYPDKEPEELMILTKKDYEAINGS